MNDWRRIDIDALLPGRLTAQELVPESDFVSLQDVTVISQQVKSLLARGEVLDALSYCLATPPYNADEKTKYAHTMTVLDVLKSTKVSQMAQIAGELASEEQDVLVKYLYKLMSVPQGQQSSGVLLAWLDKVTEAGGSGCIVRFLNDRRTV